MSTVTRFYLLCPGGFRSSRNYMWSIFNREDSEISLMDHREALGEPGFLCQRRDLDGCRGPESLLLRCYAHGSQSFQRRLDDRPVSRFLEDF